MSDQTHVNVNLNPLMDTLNLIETDLDVKSYIYQQINELTPYITPETSVIVLARDPEEAYKDENHVIAEDEFTRDNHYKYRIALVLKEEDTSIESEGFGYDIYDAVQAATAAMLQRLFEIQEEVESPQDRLNAIQQASENSQLH
ncbi:MAG: hypothetical protein ACK41T_04050 [Pseudobdellovibrio sp.]